MYEELTAQAKQAVTELLDIAKLKPGKLFVIGCSSSEMVGARIGKGSSLEAAQAAFAGIYPVLQERGIELAVQCCEHLNRALVIEREVAEAHGFEIVNAIPQLHAGGSFAMTAISSAFSASIMPGIVLRSAMPPAPITPQRNFFICFAPLQIHRPPAAVYFIIARSRHDEKRIPYQNREIQQDPTKTRKKRLPLPARGAFVFYNS